MATYQFWSRVALWLALAAISTTLSFGQAPPEKRITVRGHVVDGATGGVIKGASILGAPGKEAPKSDDSGVFEFVVDAEAKEISLQPMLEGYVPPSPFPPTFPLSGKKDKPTNIELVLFRAATVSGRLIDGESRQAIRNQPVSIGRYEYSEGHRQPVGSGGGKTGNDGRFSIPGLAPGEYALEIEPSANRTERVLTKFTQEDVKSTDAGYPRTHWPSDVSSGNLVVLSAGTEADLGTIQLAKDIGYRVLVRLDDPACTPQRKVWFQILESLNSTTLYTATTRATADGECGQKFLVTGVAPGHYFLEAMGLSNGSFAGTGATATLDIVNSNVEVEIHLAPGLDIPGSVVRPDNMKPAAWSGAEVLLFAPHAMNFRGTDPAKISDEGTYAVKAVIDQEWQVKTRGFDRSQCYVKEIRYNGSPVTGRSFRLNRYAQAQSFVVELSDRPATISGVVHDRDRSPVPAIAGVIEAEATEPYGAVSYFDVAGDGRFRVLGLRPGKYCAFAIATDQRESLDRPGVLQGLIANGVNIELEEGSTRELTIELR